MRRFPIAFAALVLMAWVPCAPAAEPATKTRNVILVTTDGLRWQEVFGGADAELMNKKNGGVSDEAALKREFWRETPQARREALMPFLWSEIGRRGQLFGNFQRGSEARVTNGKNFSYPGYSELLTGHPDPRIDSNDKKPNPNVNVLEWLNSQSEFQGKVAAFGSWDVFPFILNRERSGLLVNAGWEPLQQRSTTPAGQLLNDLMRDTPKLWGGVRFDSFTFQAALEHFKENRPRVLYIGLGETDEYSHEGHYDRYLQAAHRVDSFLQTLWNTVQSMPDFRDTTTLIVTVDHGRGNAPEEWKHHGEKIKGSERIWVGILGPDTRPLGERANVEVVTQSQIAATLATLLGQDYRAHVQEAAPPITSVLP